MELLALTSTKMENDAPEVKERWTPRHKSVLQMLEEEARAAGRAGEADLYRDVAAGL
jgi:hypothetical protein